eukprot:1964627-Rhodomonas_salina.4
MSGPLAGMGSHHCGQKAHLVPASLVGGEHCTSTLMVWCRAIQGILLPSLNLRASNRLGPAGVP